jgi:hypothetical protein
MVIEILGAASPLGILVSLLTPETGLRDPDILDRHDLAEST